MPQDDYSVSVGIHATTGAGARTVKRDFDKMGDAADRAARRAATLDKILAKLAKIAKLAAIAMVALTVAVGVGVSLKAITSWARLEQGLANVGAVASATSADMQRLKVASLEAAAATKFDTREATEGLYSMASAGFTVEEQIKGLKPVLDLAAATAGDLGGAAEQVVMSLRGFGLEASEAGKVADILTAATQKSALNAERLTGAISNSAAIANAYGQELEGTVAALGILTTALGDGAVAGTSLSGSWIQMTDKTKAAGVAMKDAEGDILPLVDILTNFEKAGINAAEAMDLFGARGGKAMSILLEAGSEKLRAMEASIQANGQAAEVAARQMDNLSGDVDKLKSVWDVFLVTLGEDAAAGSRGAVRDLADKVRDLTTWVKENSDEIRTRFAQGWKAVTATINLAIKVFETVATNIDTATVALVAFTGTLALLKLSALGGLALTGLEAIALGFIGVGAASTAATAATGKLILLLSGPGSLAMIAAVVMGGMWKLTEKYVDEVERGHKAELKRIENYNDTNRLAFELLKTKREITDEEAKQVLVSGLLMRAELEKHHAIVLELRKRKAEAEELYGKAPRILLDRLEEEEALWLSLDQANLQYRKTLAIYARQIEELSGKPPPAVVPDPTELSDTEKAMAKLAVRYGRNAEEQRRLNEAALEGEEAVDKLQTVLKVENDLLALGLPLTDEYAQNLFAMAEAARLYAAGVDTATAKQKMFDDALEKTIESYEKNRAAAEGFLKSIQTPLEEFQERLIEAQRLFAEGWLTQEQYEKIEKDLYDSIVKPTEEGIDKAKELWISFSRSLQSSFAEGIEDILSGEEDAFDNFFDGILDMFKKMIAEMIAYALTKRILLNIGTAGGGEGGGGMMGMFGQMFGGGGQGGIGSMFGGGGGDPNQMVQVGTMAGGSPMMGPASTAGGGGFWSSFGSMFGGTMGTGTGGGSAFGGMGGMAGGMGIAGGILGGLAMGQMADDLDKYDYGEVGNLVGTGIGTAVGAYFGGPLGAQIGGTLGGLFGQMIGDAINKTKPEIMATIGATQEGLIEVGVQRLVGPASDIQEAFDEYVDTFEGVANAFIGSLGGTVTDLADGVELAMRVDGQMWYRVIVDGVKHGFATIEEALKFALEETFARATVEDAAGTMIDALGELDQFFADAEALGIDWAEALKKGAIGILEAREEILGKKQGLLSTLADAMTKAGMNANMIAAQRAKIEQQIFLVSLKKLELELTAFGMMTDAIKGILKSLTVWASDVANFLPDVTIKAPRGGRGRGGPSKKDQRAELIRFLQGFELNDFALAMVDLNKTFDDAAKKAKKLGVEEERVARARAVAVQELVEDLFQPIWDLQEELAMGELGKKPGEQFSAVQARFNELRERALAGDLEAIQQLPDAIRRFRDFAAQYFGTSSAAFQAIMDQIEATLAAVAPTQADVAAALDEATMAQLAALDDIEDVLNLIADLLGGMGMQHGGPIAGGQVEIVGEAGRELFVAPRAGNILPFVKRDEEEWAPRRAPGRPGAGAAEVTQAVKDSAIILQREMQGNREASEESREQLEEMKTATQELNRLLRRYLTENETKRAVG